MNTTSTVVALRSIHKRRNGIYVCELILMATFSGYA